MAFYTHLLIDLNWEWQKISQNLHPRDISPDSFVQQLTTDYLLPFVTLLTAAIIGGMYLFYGSEFEKKYWLNVCIILRYFLSFMDEPKIPGMVVVSKIVNSKGCFCFLSLLAGYLSIIGGLITCLGLIPLTIHGDPWKSWVSYMMLGWTMFYLLFGCIFCRLCYFSGVLKRASIQVKKDKKPREPPVNPRRHTLLWFVGMPLYMAVFLLWLYNDTTIVHKPLFKFWALVSSGVTLLFSASTSFARLGALWLRFGRYSNIDAHVL